MPESAPCAGCGLVLPGGTDGCRELFDEETALHFTDVQYFAIHRLFVDTYMLQHPDTGCISFKSLSAHLAHLCWSLEHGGSRAVPSEAIRRWIERNPDLPRPGVPEKRGVITIAHVLAAANAQAHRMAVDLWAKSVWEAYGALQPLAREWVKQALDEKQTARPH
jgi:hypothetical protein